MCYLKLPPPPLFHILNKIAGEVMSDCRTCVFAAMDIVSVALTCRFRLICVVTAYARNVKNTGDERQTVKSLPLLL
jgi:hypothetical protein